ncbi:hypothetical protein DFH11DRAFT_1038602 [Phellopilus nigrolimitatus]|nr:hypothetical protein DFH11DRAFT_1038602 [Phellopilus nigrolimitatus]
MAPGSNFLSPYLEEHPVDFIGPQILGALVQAVEVGILTNQAVYFFSGVAQERRWILVTVSLALMISTIQTCMSFYSIWRLTVHNFGNWAAVVVLFWTDKTQLILNGLASAPVQCYFIWRCWVITEKRLYVLIPLLAILVASITSMVVITIELFNIDTETVTVHPHLPYAFVLSYVFSALLDIALTVIMLSYLIKARKYTVSKHTNHLVLRLMRTACEAAIPPCICAIAVMCAYVTSSEENFWDIFVQIIMGKVYCICFLAVLNGRDQLRSMPETSFHTSSPIPGFAQTGTMHSAILVQMSPLRREHDGKDSLLDGQLRRASTSYSTD